LRTPTFDHGAAEPPTASYRGAAQLSDSAAIDRPHTQMKQELGNGITRALDDEDKSQAGIQKIREWGLSLYGGQPIRKLGMP